MIALYFGLIAGLLLKHWITPSAAGAFALLGFAVWLVANAMGAL